MKYLLLLAITVLCSSSAWAVAGGTAANDSAIQTALGLNFTPQSQLDTPEIPIGPRVAITCGHCVAADAVPGVPSADDGFQIVFPPQMKSGTDDTANEYDSLPSGTYGLPFFEKANYSYDLALVILDSGNSYFGPYMSVGKNRVRLNEALTFLGKGMNTSTADDFCNGHSTQFAFAPFHVIDFYGQQVGFIATAKPAATCSGDSGGYYFRILADQSLELVGINSWGTENGTQQISQYGAVRNFQGFLSGANDLTSPGIQQWLSSVVTKYGIDICGLNKACPPVKSPF